jgi:hypothetical protein
MRNDHCQECQEVVARFAGKTWPELSVDDLRGNPGPGLLTAVGFRYYLPAMMLRCMEARQELDCFPGGVIGQLSQSRETDRLRFTREQQKAILRFLYCMEMYEKIEWSEPDWPEEAIRSVPTEKSLARAIRLWSARVPEDAS